MRSAIAIPMPIPMPAAIPPPPPGFSADLVIASAVLNSVYFDRSPATEIEVRLSRTFSTSSGSEMFSM